MHSTAPLAITPLVLDSLPITKAGLTPFTYSRFLVPWLCGYQGLALFVDGDVLFRADVEELFRFVEQRRLEGEDCAVWTVPLAPAERFERAAIMVYDCGHPDNYRLTPELVQAGGAKPSINWTTKVGDLPPNWHHIVLYHAENKDAKLVHFTAGVPAYGATYGCEFTEEYVLYAQQTVRLDDWVKVMGHSVHVEKVLQKFPDRFVVQRPEINH